MIYIGDKKVKKCYVGDEAIGRVYLGDELLFSKTSRLPKGYREVEYIQSNGTQYVDTGVKVTSGSKIVMDVELTSVNSYYASYFFDSASAGTNSGYNYVFRIFASADNTVNAAMGAYYKTVSNVKLGDLKSLKRLTLLLDAPNRIGALDGAEAAVGNTNFASSMNTLRLLNISNNKATSFRASAKLYSCKMYTGESPTCDFVPCINPSGTVGLYDLVGGKFYGNAGTGVFAAGPVV